MNVNRLYVVGAVLREDDGGIWTDPAQTRKATYADLRDAGWIPVDEAGEHAEEYHQAVSRRIQQLGAEGRRALAERDEARTHLMELFREGLIVCTSANHHRRCLDCAEIARLRGIYYPTPEEQEETPAKGEKE